MPKKPKAWDRLNMADRLAWVESLARDGLTDQELAKRIGISRTTLKTWKNEYPEFAEALARGKEVPDAQVEKALYKMATGFYYTEEHAAPTGKVVELRKYQVPNTTAMIFWLKNRKHTHWRDKVDVGHEGQVNHEIEVSWKGPQFDEEDGGND